MRDLDQWRSGAPASPDGGGMSPGQFGRTVEDREAVAQGAAGRQWGVQYPAGRGAPNNNGRSPTGGGGGGGGKWGTKGGTGLHQPAPVARAWGSKKTPVGALGAIAAPTVVENAPVRELGGGQVALELPSRSHPSLAKKVTKGMRRANPPVHAPRRPGGDNHISRKLNGHPEAGEKPPVPARTWGRAAGVLAAGYVSQYRAPDDPVPLPDMRDETDSDDGGKASVPNVYEPDSSPSQGRRPAVVVSDSDDDSDLG